MGEVRGSAAREVRVGVLLLEVGLRGSGGRCWSVGGGIRSDLEHLLDLDESLGEPFDVRSEGVVGPPRWARLGALCTARGAGSASPAVAARDEAIALQSSRRSA
jgi:hypothetical protein